MNRAGLFGAAEWGQKGLRQRWREAKAGSAGGRGASSDQQRAHCAREQKTPPTKQPLRLWGGAGVRISPKITPK